MNNVTNVNTANQNFEVALKKLEPEFQKVLSSKISSEKFCRVVLTHIKKNPKLLEVDRTSLYSAIMEAAESGLLPDGKNATIIAFKNRAKFIPMVFGILKKIRETQEVKTITVNVVYESDEFKYFIDEKGEHLLHRPNIMNRSSDEKVILTYCLAILKGGGIKVEIINESEMEKIRKTALSQEGPWLLWEDEMRKKSVIRRFAKRFLSSHENLDYVIEKIDNDLVSDDASQTEEATKTVSSEENDASSLKEALRATLNS